MSALTRLLHPIPSTRRAYSFFSSKPGGGRYFNSAKPPKVVATGHNSGKGPGPGPGAAKPSVQSSTTPASANSAPADPVALADESAVSSPAPPTAASEGTPFAIPSGSAPWARTHQPPVHPSVSAQDYKLHQFFSLHRPLLLLAQPASAVFESGTLPSFDGPQGHSLATDSAASDSATAAFDDPPEASPEADADAARQLARALVMNRAGAAISWEGALKRLGLDVAAERGPAVEEDLAGLAVHLDSTKRKRRKKMKKHKLKKRRRLTRATRLKLR